MRNTAKKIAPAWCKRLYHRAKGLVNRRRSGAEVFGSIYKTSQWGGSGDFDSGAGTGDADVAAPYIEAVAKALEERGLVGTTFVDLGCGDFRIGSRIAELASFYVGCDVVPDLIEHLSKRHGNERVHFEAVDMVKDELPSGDVAFIRQVLQHLSNEQIASVLPKLSKYKYVFVTEHVPNRRTDFQANRDKAQGPDIRLYWGSGVMLDQSPFSIPSSSLSEILAVKGTPIWDGHDPGEIVTWIYRPETD